MASPGSVICHCRPRMTFLAGQFVLPLPSAHEGARLLHSMGPVTLSVKGHTVSVILSLMHVLPLDSK